MYEDNICRKKRNTGKKKYETGFALSGGGARGFAHLGAIQALKENGIEPEIISGVSAGSLAGAFIADGFSPEEIMEVFSKVKFKEFTDLTLSFVGFSKTTKIQSLLKKYLRAKTFEELKLPLIVTTTDFDKGETVFFSKGSLYAPVAASCSFPVVFTPTKIKGVNYADGGLFKNFPVSPIRELCEKVVGVNVSPAAPQYARDNLIGVVEKCIHFVLDSTTLNDAPLCDILIKPEEVGKYSIFDVKHAKDIYELGYKATIDVLNPKEKKPQER